jgi:hypothetical protein
MIRTILFSILLLTAATAQIPYGKEFQVNTNWQDDQFFPAVAALADGGFVVCWNSGIAKNYTYTDHNDIYAQRYSVDGMAIGGEFIINTFQQDLHLNPSIAALTDGGFVVCWVSLAQEDSVSGIYAQRYDADSKPAGHEFQVGSVGVPSVAALSNGGFVVCWVSCTSDVNLPDISARCYGSDGKPMGSEFQVNSYWQDDQSEPAVAHLANGGFVICWQSFEQDGSDYGIFAQRFGIDGKPVSEEFQVNTVFEEGQIYPSVVALSGGGFAVFWKSYCWDCRHSGVCVQRYNENGNPVGSEYQLNTAIGPLQDFDSIAVLADDSIVAAFESSQTGWHFGINAYHFDTSGNSIGSEFFVSTYQQGVLWDASITVLANSGFVVCWTSEDQDGSGYGIYAKRYPAEPQRHELRPFALLEPKHDATVMDGKPMLSWQPASELTIAYPWELEYTVYYDTLADFSTPSVKAAGPDTTVKLPALKLGATYFWKVLAKTYYGDSLWSDVGAFFVSHTATEVAVEVEAVPGQFAVLSNYPNPFNPSTTIRFELHKDGYVTVKIYDLNGRLVKVLLSGEQTAGTHTAVWDGTDDAGRKVAAGVYFCQLEYTDASGVRQVLTQKMSLVR